MSKGVFQKEHTNKGDALLPVDDAAHDIMKAWKRGKQGLVSTHLPRNIHHHKLLFALLKKITDGGAWEGDTDSLLIWIKIGVGHVDMTIGPDGRTYFIPKSINYESMSQDKFSRFFDRAVYLISTRLLGNEDWVLLRNEVWEMVEGKLPERRVA